MKTPKEILLERHRAADTRLDGIRQTVLANECRTVTQRNAENRGRVLLGVATKIWAELVWPVRRIWAGFAVVWIAMAALHLTVSGQSDGTTVATGTASSEILVVWQEQKKVMAELTGTVEPVDTERPKVIAPKPRSQRRTVFRIG